MSKLVGVLCLATALAGLATPVLAQDCGCAGGGDLSAGYAYRGGEGLGRFQADYGPVAGAALNAGEEPGAPPTSDCPAGRGERVISCRYIALARPAPAYAPASYQDEGYDSGEVPFTAYGGGGYVYGGGGGGGGGFISSDAVRAGAAGFAASRATASAESSSQVDVQVSEFSQGDRRRHHGGSGQPYGQGGGSYGGGSGGSGGGWSSGGGDGGSSTGWSPSGPGEGMGWSGGAGRAAGGWGGLNLLGMSGGVHGWGGGRGGHHMAMSSGVRRR